MRLEGWTWDPDVDAAWWQLTSEILDTLTKAVQALNPALLANMPKGLLRRRKSDTAKFIPDSAVIRVAAGEHAIFVKSDSRGS